MDSLFSTTMDFHKLISGSPPSPKTSQSTSKQAVLFHLQVGRGKIQTPGSFCSFQTVWPVMINHLQGC